MVNADFNAYVHLTLGLGASLLVVLWDGEEKETTL